MAVDETYALVKKIVAALVACGKNLFLYPAGHPQTAQGTAQLWQMIFMFLRSRPQLVLSFSDSEVFYEHDLLVEESLTCQTLINTCAAKKINRITFLPGLTEGDLARFLVFLNRDFDSEHIDFAAELKRAEVKYIEIKRLVAGSPVEGDPRRRTPSTRAHQHQYKQALTSLEQVFDQAYNEQPIAIERVDAIVEWLVGNLITGDSTILALTALKDHDEYTCHHSIKVAILSVALGHKLGLDRQRLTWLATGALLHDIGKINVPKEIINKPGRLTAEEWQIMKGHPIESTQILSGLPTLEKSALIVAFEHHIGYDLSGYPVKTQTRAPHLFSRIVQIADTYDGLTSTRSYHAAYAPTEALNYMLCVMPKAFDPILLRLFIKTLGVYPIGAVVRLNTGQLAIVIDENPADLLNPRVKIVDETSSGQIIDLTACPAVMIDAVLSPDATEIDLVKELAAGV